MANTTKYRTLVVAKGADSEPDLKARHKRLNDLAAEGWTLVTTVTIDGKFIDTLVQVSAE